MITEEFSKPHYIMSLDKIHQIIEDLNLLMDKKRNLDDSDSIMQDLIMLRSYTGSINTASASAKYWFGHYNGLVLDKFLAENKGQKGVDKITSSTILVLKAESELKEFKFLVDCTTGLVFSLQNLIVDLKYILNRLDNERQRDKTDNIVFELQEKVNKLSNRVI